jgi:sigma-B regulation protein RsbU (phosphoserine phosphatase)
VTLFIGLLDTVTGMLRYLNGGHVRPYVLPQGAAPFQLVCPADVPLGFDPDFPFRVGVMSLAEGDALVVVTDGVHDMTNVDGRMFGGAATMACLSGATDRRAASLVAGLRDTVFAFGHGAEQSDDVTILALRFG